MFIELVLRETANRKAVLSTNADSGNHGARSRRAQRGSRYSAAVASPRFI